MERQVFHRDDVRNILEAIVEAGNALVKEQCDDEFIRGYATAIRLIATAFGFVNVYPTMQGTVLPSARALWDTDRYNKRG